MCAPLLLFSLSVLFQHKNPNKTQSVFGCVVAVAFQITFRVEMHVNDVFLFFKKLFLTSAHQNDPKNTNIIKF